MNIGVICEYSAIVRDAFIRKGHNAISVDLEPSESSMGNHWEGSLEEFLWARRKLKTFWGSLEVMGSFDIIIAHPPCTYFTNAGVRWFHERPERMRYFVDMVNLWRLIESIPCKGRMIENPIPHKYALGAIGRKYDQIIQPWQFGHGETKAICLWLESLSPLKPTKVVEGREARVHKMSPGPDRGKERSRFYTGIAEAMAEQWT